MIWLAFYSKAKGGECSKKSYKISTSPQNMLHNIIINICYICYITLSYKYVTYVI